MKPPVLLFYSRVKRSWLLECQPITPSFAEYLEDMARRYQMRTPMERASDG